MAEVEQRHLCPNNTLPSLSARAVGYGFRLPPPSHGSTLAPRPPDLTQCPVSRIARELVCSAAAPHPVARGGTTEGSKRHQARFQPGGPRPNLAQPQRASAEPAHTLRTLHPPTWDNLPGRERPRARARTHGGKPGGGARLRWERNA